MLRWNKLKKWNEWTVFCKKKTSSVDKRVQWINEMLRKVGKEEQFVQDIAQYPAGFREELYCLRYTN